VLGWVLGYCLLQVEKEVQNVYAYELSRKCEMEKAAKSRVANSARRAYSKEDRDRLTREAMAMPLDSCSTFHQLFG